jgi:hypothetical protein
MTLDVQGFKRHCHDVKVAAADGCALISQDQMQLLRRSAVVFSLIDTAKQEAEHNLEAVNPLPRSRLQRQSPTVSRRTRAV